MFFVFLFLAALLCEDIYCKEKKVPLISEGYPAPKNKFPYQVFLQIIKDGKFFECGGSIISNQTILTAAHCLIGASTIYVKMGVTSINAYGKTVGTTRFTPHPEYNNETHDYDIGLIFLDDPVKLDGVKTKAVLLAGAGIQVEPGQEITVTGWGYTSEKGNYSDVLMAVEVLVLSNDECRKTYPKLTTRMFCAGDPEGGKDACQGDSGGPAVINSGKIQVGVVSNGIGCGRKDYPGVYTSVSSVRDWIKQVSGV